MLSLKLFQLHQFFLRNLTKTKSVFAFRLILSSSEGKKEHKVQGLIFALNS